MTTRREGKEEGRREKEGEKLHIRIKGNAVTTIVRLVMLVYCSLSLSFSIAIFTCTHAYMIHLGWLYA